MNDILERAKEAQREHATGTTLFIRLAFLQDLIAEIETLRKLVRYPPAQAIGSIKDINQRHAKQIGSEEPQ